jgi:hypothetical protein
MKISDETHVLALVLLYSKPDMNLFEQSYWAVYSIMQLDPIEGLCVVDAKSIRSVVSVQLHDHQLEDGEQ